MSMFKTIANYFGFYTTDSTVTSVPNSDGVLVSTVVDTPTSFVYPSQIEEYELIGIIVMGTAPVAAAAGVAAVAGSAPDSFMDFPLAAIDFNPPLQSFSVSRIRSVVLRTPAIPHDVNWYAGIWATTPPAVAAVNTFNVVRRRSPCAAWQWRSTITVPQPSEVAIPWPSRAPIADSLHAVLPGLHAPSLQIGCWNGPAGTASALPAGQYTFEVVVKVEVAGRGLFGHL
jgi:hypothetical protein